MALSVEAAYEQIKKLENTGQLKLPQPQETVEVGTIDPAKGTFAWSVPTQVQTISEPPLPGEKPSPPTELTIGVVNTTAVDLRLKFAVIPLRPKKPVSAQGIASRAAVDPARPAVDPARTAANSARTVAARVQIDGELAGETNGGTTVTGFPTVVSTATEITLDAGLVCSVAEQDPFISPPISRVGVTIEIPGQPPMFIWLFVFRPPVVGIGAFTVPALPMAVVYAPPQGKLLKNTATYQESEVFTRTVSSSLTTSTTTKTVQAYTAAELFAKAVGLVNAAIAVAGSGGEAGSPGAEAVAAAKEVGAGLTLVSDVVSGLEGSVPPSESDSVTTETDHSLALTWTYSELFPSEAGLGPGDGDRIVYLKDVKVIWMVLNGEVGISILGFAGPGANSAHDLLAEQQSLASGEPATLGLDAETIKSLLHQDPLISGHRPVVSQHFGPAVVGPPRFVPAHPPGHSGSGTGSSGTGDQIIVTYEATTEDKQTTTTTQTNVTDMKPGFLEVLFGAENTDTTTTGILTNTQSVDTKTGEKLTSTITFFSEGIHDPYDVKIFYDRTFGTFAILDADSPLLVGSPPLNVMATEA